ncbi:MAG: class I SAM-dependent methyltransferase [Luteolibacter sp.]
MSFDRIAPFYRWMEMLSAGGKLQRCRTAHLDSVGHPKHILILGEGHGRFLPVCAEKFPEAEITVIDASGRMLEIAKSRTKRQDIEWMHADILRWEAPENTYDLIVTHFFLDCFTREEMPAVIALLSRAATDEATWLLADFQIASRGLAKWRSRVILALLYRFFRIVSALRPQQLVSPEPWLAEHGFHLKARITYDWELLKSERWRREK